MSRRSGPAEMQFGSDSFLDVLANMVGILIILIVIAGARVGRAPTPKLAEIERRKTLPTLLIPGPSIESVDAPAVPLPPAPPEAEPELEPALDFPPPLPDEPPDPAVPPDDLARQLADLEAEQADLDARRDALATRLAQLNGADHSSRRTLEDRSRRLAAQASALEARRSQLNDLQQGVGVRRKSLAALLAEFEQVENSRPPARQITHRITPVSQTVNGPEIHLRLAGNRVSVVPVDLLVERLKSQIERQKEWVARFKSHQGSVGPVGGYSMNYVIERQALSPLEELRHGSGLFRIGVSMWQIAPEDDLQTESAAEALTPGSRFARALGEAPENATITCWVYPDSFGLFRQLQQAAHKEGFHVSARPLPDGVPIAGSPNGSRSAGQ